MITEREKKILKKSFHEITSPDWYVGMIALYIAREHPEKDVDTIVKQVDDLWTDFEKCYGEINQEEVDREMTT